MDDDQSPSDDGSQPHLQHIKANTPPLLSKHSFLKNSFIFINMTILLTQHDNGHPAPAFLNDDPLPQYIDGSAPTPTLHKIELQLKLVRNIEKIIKTVSG